MATREAATRNCRRYGPGHGSPIRRMASRGGDGGNGSPEVAPGGFGHLGGPADPCGSLPGPWRPRSRGRRGSSRSRVPRRRPRACPCANSTGLGPWRRFPRRPPPGTWRVPGPIVSVSAGSFRRVRRRGFPRRGAQVGQQGEKGVRHGRAQGDRRWGFQATRYREGPGRLVAFTALGVAGVKSSRAGEPSGHAMRAKRVSRSSMLKGVLVPAGSSPYCAIKGLFILGGQARWPRRCRPATKAPGPRPAAGSAGPAA